MSLTEEQLTKILKKELDSLKAELISDFAKDLRKEVNSITATLNSIKSSANTALNKAKDNEHNKIKQTITKQTSNCHKQDKMRN